MDPDLEHRGLLAGASPAMTSNEAPYYHDQESPPLPSYTEHQPASWLGDDPPTMVTSPIPPVAQTLRRSATSYPRKYTRINSLPSSTDALTRSVSGPGRASTTPQSSESNDGLGITVQADLRQSPARIPSPHVSPQLRNSLEGQVVSSASLTPSSSVLSGRTITFDEEDDTAYKGYYGQHNNPAMSADSFGSGRYTSQRTPTIHEDDAEDDAPVGFARRDGRRTRPIKRSLGGWLSIVAFTLAIFCAIFSGIFLAIAINSPYWGRNVSSNQGKLSPSAAATLTSFFAKMIEMAFVTVMVAFIGQILARRAILLENAEGITLSEMTMRAWIMQPGTIITQWESVRYAGPTLLGVVCLLTAVLSILYTSAATSLVQPQLRLSEWSHRDMAGPVRSQFANPFYIEKVCSTPISSSFDPEHAQDTCVQMEHAAMAYHNYFGYISSWTDFIAKNKSGDTLKDRPQGFALLNDNTTVSAPWIEQQNVKTFNETHPRYINNVTMAMPHIGVIQAAISPKNELMQPAEADGSMYHIRAAVPSPFINVLCATVIEEDMHPFLLDRKDKDDAFARSSSVADIFGFGPKYGPERKAPVFKRLPIAHNTLINDTVGVSYGRPTIFILGKGGLNDSAGRNISQYYSLCQLQVGLTPFCSTNYNASATGATMDATCGDPYDRYTFNTSMQANTTYGNATINLDWPNIAGDWARSLSMNDGSFDGNSSNARLLTQFMVTTPRLNPKLPSMAEAIAVLAGCTLLQSIDGTPFDQNWPFAPGKILDASAAVYQPFNATVRVLQYASGGVWDHQKGWFCVLLLVFAANLMALGYFVSHRHWYTDVAEPTNLFLLAINSPPSRHLAEAVEASAAAAAAATRTSGKEPRHGSWKTDAPYQVPWKVMRTDHTSGGEHSGCSGYMLESQAARGYVPLQQRKGVKKSKKQRNTMEMKSSPSTTSSARLSKRSTFAGFNWDRRKTFTSPTFGMNQQSGA